MKNKFLLSFFAGVLSFLLCATAILAQPTRQGLPASIKMSIPNITSSTLVSSSSIDWAAVANEDKIAEQQNMPMRIGFSLPVEKSIDKDGEWTQLPDGRMMWRIKLESPNAISLGVVFSMFHLPQDAELYLYNADKSFVIGAFTTENNNPNNVFSTHLVPGSTIILEYIEKTESKFDIKTFKHSGEIKQSSISKTITASRESHSEIYYKPKGVLQISELIYAYNDRINESTRDLGGSGSCQVNINCSPEGDNWQDEKRGVARISFREGTSWYWCRVLL